MTQAQLLCIGVLRPLRRPENVLWRLVRFTQGGEWPLKESDDPGWPTRVGEVSAFEWQKTLLPTMS